MIAIGTNSQRNLETLKLTHFEGVAPIIKSKIDNLVALPATIRQHLLEEGRLLEIVVARPDRLLELEQALQRACNRRGIRTLKAWLKRIFHYKTFRRKDHQPYNAYHLAANLNVRVCPYCNRQYIFTVINETDNFSRPEFDHFFDQGNHPLLALSFYNLIPSCKICNSTLKGKKKLHLDRHLHPYLYAFENAASFNYHAHDYDGSVGNSDNMTLTINVNSDHGNATRVKGNIEMFKLIECYQDHRDVVQEIVRKFYISNGEYLRTLHKTFPKIGSMDELYRLAFGNYYTESNFEKRVLAKLTKDIAVRLSLLEGINESIFDK